MRRLDRRTFSNPFHRTTKFVREIGRALRRSIASTQSRLTSDQNSDKAVFARAEATIRTAIRLLHQSQRARSISLPPTASRRQYQASSRSSGHRRLPRRQRPSQP